MPEAETKSLLFEKEGHGRKVSRSRSSFRRHASLKKFRKFSWVRIRRAPNQKGIQMDNLWITRKAINETIHFKDQARLRRIDLPMVRDGIGLDILLAEEGAGLRCDRSDKNGRGLATPEIGKPVHIGRHFGDKGKNREVLLVKLPNGRRLHLVVLSGLRVEESGPDHRLVPGRSRQPRQVAFPWPSSHPVRRG